MMMEVVRDDAGPTHPPAAEKVAAVDFDGTIKPWAGGLFGFIDPLPGAVEAVKRLKDAGYRVVIFTSRLSTVWHEAEGWDTHEATIAQVEYIRQYCEKFGIDADAVTAEKIPAEVYLDDKAMTVNENETLLAQVEQFVSTGVFYLKPPNSRRGPRWHRVNDMPVLKEYIGHQNKKWYRWEGETACGQPMWFRHWGENKPSEKDLFKADAKFVGHLARQRGREPYCLHCEKADRKKERAV